MSYHLIILSFVAYSIILDKQYIIIEFYQNKMSTQKIQLKEENKQNSVNQNKQASILSVEHPKVQSELEFNRGTYFSIDSDPNTLDKDISFQIDKKQMQNNQDDQNKINVSQIKPNYTNQQSKIQQNAHKQQFQTINQKKQEIEYQSQRAQQALINQIPKQLIETCQQITKQLFNKLEMQQIRKEIEQRLNPLYEQFCKAYDNLLADAQIQQSINTYSQILVKYWDQDMFFQHFVQNKYLSILMNKIRQFKYAADIVKVVFGCLEYLLRGLGSQSGVVNNKISNKEEQFIYLLVMINKQGFITQNYKFSQIQDWAYYAHFMKLLVRIINQADKAEEKQLKRLLATQSQLENNEQVSSSFTFSPQKNQHETPIQSKLKTLKSFQFQQIYSKYLTIFFNKKIPQFPLLLKLLYFYKWSDTILQTSVKLCLLQISNHPNRKLQKYFLNFPFVTFYLLYCTKISDNIEKYLAFGTLRFASQKQSQKQQILIEQIISDIKFMQDFLKVEEQQQLGQNKTLPILFNSIKSHNIQQHLNMYINTFYYYIGRAFYQNLLKYITQQNINGVINGLLLMIKILKINTVLKIKLGFQEMLHKYINCDLFDYLKSKRQRLDNQKYWMFDQCQTIIREHLDTILFQDSPDTNQQQKVRLSMGQGNINNSARMSMNSQKILLSQRVDLVQVSSSVSKSTLPSANAQKPKKSTPYSSMLFKTVRSFIPTTNSNWLYYEMKKISQVLGLQVILNKQIQHSYLSLNSNSYYKNSFLSIIDNIQQNNYNGNNKMIMNKKKSLLSRFSSPIKMNQLFVLIINTVNRGSIKHTNSGSSSKSGQSLGNKKTNEDNTQQLIYYYLVLLCSIKDTHTHSDHTNNITNSEKVGEGKMDNINTQQISQLLKITRKCRSLMLVGIMYWYIKLLDYQLQQKNNDFLILRQSANQQLLAMSTPLKQQHNPKLQQNNNNKNNNENGMNNTIAADMLEAYMNTMQKLVYYILSEGWQPFIKHVKSIKTIIWNKYKYNNNNSHINNNYSNSNNSSSNENVIIKSIMKQPSQQQLCNNIKIKPCTYEYQDCNKHPSTQFYNDIFRDTQCDIVYFIMLRHIFGTRNTREELPDDIEHAIDVDDKDTISKEIKVPCRLTGPQGDLVYLIMDGQYIKFMTMEDVLITKKPISVSCFNIYQQDVPNFNYDGEPEEGDIFMNAGSANKSPIKSQIKEKVKKTAVFQLVDKNINGECFTVHFDQLLIREYVAKEIKSRKKATMNIQMCLRTMRFDIQ